MAVVRILGIDPGTRVVGFACLEAMGDRLLRGPREVPLAMRAGNAVRATVEAGRTVQVVEFGVMRLGRRGSVLTERLLALADQFRGLVARLRPGEIALEEAFSGKSVQAALRIGEARGVVLAEAARAGLQVHQFAPARIKRCVTGNGAASKQSVAAMVGHLLFGGGAAAPDDVPADATDALAVALTRFEMRSSPLGSLGASSEPA